jgi:hypothetical protein
MNTVSGAPVQTLRTAVSRARLAPSVHNTQPWRFVLAPDSLEIHADPTRQLDVLDPTRRQLYVSLGCALMNARVSLAGSGCPSKVVRLPDADAPLHVATIELTDGQPVDPALAALNPAVDSRQTNRRQFTPDPVPAELVATLVAAAAAEGARLHEITEPEDRQTLARLSQQADTLQLTDAAYRAELRNWTSNDPARLDGVRAAVVPHVDGTSGDEVPIRDFDTQGAGWLPPGTQSTTKQCLLVLGTDTDSPLAWVRAGEALERVWLEITKAGFVASLFTQVIEIGAIRVHLRDQLRLGMQAHVVLRVGRAPVTAASMRRHVDDMLDDHAATSPV